MDPEITWARVNDQTLPFAERGDAALDLLAWLANGGFTPVSMPPGSGGARDRADTIGICVMHVRLLLEDEDNA